MCAITETSRPTRMIQSARPGEGGLADLPQPVRVVIEGLLAHKDLEVASHVREEETHQDDSADRHDDLEHNSGAGA